MRTTLASAIIFAAGTASAGSYRAENYLVVNPISSSQFEVIEARGEGARGLFCAAASYVERQLGVKGARVYVLTPRSPSRTVAGRKAVAFTIDPNDVTPVSGASVSVSQIGYGLPVFHARQFCKDIYDKDDYEWELN